ncbi:MAG: class I SAM-dependent methyltransferase, partial [Fibrobacter sp.]|nr:class I SAM-dependent methyltransferase [Fibrobacter sp.]
MFDGDIHALRAPERLKKLEVERVVELSLEQLFVTKVLDIGTGTGVFAESFSLRNINVTGIDTNPNMLSAASKLVTNVDFKEAPAEKLPFDDKSFDIVF